MDKYVSMDTSMLKNNKRYPNNHSIKYVSPYAKYQYYGKLMLAKNGSSWAKLGETKVKTNKDLKYRSSGRGAKWDKLMLQRRKNDLVRDVTNYIKQGG